MIPMAALVAVMIMVSVGDVRLAQHPPAHPAADAEERDLVMVATVGGHGVRPHNLAIGVVVGVLVAMVLFARRVAHLTVTRRSVGRRTSDGPTAHYRVTGELFFASSNDLDHPVRLRRRPGRAW